MAGLSDLFGKHGVIEQLVLWGVLAEVVRAAGAPGLDTLAQDVAAKHPVQVLTPETLAELVAHKHMPEGEAKAEAGRSGIDAERFARLLAMATIRLAPADLSTAVLRSYMSKSDA